MSSWIWPRWLGRRLWSLRLWATSSWSGDIWHVPLELVVFIWPVRLHLHLLRGLPQDKWDGWEGGQDYQRGHDSPSLSKCASTDGWRILLFPGRWLRSLHEHDLLRNTGLGCSGYLRRAVIHCTLGDHVRCVLRLRLEVWDLCNWLRRLDLVWPLSSSVASRLDVPPATADVEHCSVWARTRSRRFGVSWVWPRSVELEKVKDKKKKTTDHDWVLN